MNPFPMVLADLRAMRGLAAVVVVVVALAVAIGVAVAAQERAIRAGSARAADDFDLLVGAPGSQTQLVLTTVFLQPEALPLMDGEVLRRFAAEKGVRSVAPVAFGDMVRGYPVVGTTAAFATRNGRLRTTEGRVFAAEGEAVVGADVRLAVGSAVTPSHGVAGRHAAGEESEEEHRHRHEGVAYRIVGRMARLGSPWDRAIIVPVESVWEVHGLGNGHAVDGGPVGPPWDAVHLPGLPAIVVQPVSVADAYALRGRYRTGGTMAFFPAEVLVDLYRTLGDLRAVMTAMAFANQVLVFAAILLALAAVLAARHRRYAVLRALGASRGYVLLVVWLGGSALVAAGALAGLAAGWGVAAGLSAWFSGRSGLVLTVGPAWEDITLVGGFVAAGTLLALVPALLAYRRPVAAGLRS